MKIDILKIPAEGLRLSEQFTPEALDLNTELIEFRSPLTVQAEISKISNAVSVKISCGARVCARCSRCLEEYSIDLKKDIALHYTAEREHPMIDMDPDIREEIILDYPIKPLCKPSCKGLCPKCGKNLNEGGCTCGST